MDNQYEEMRQRLLRQLNEMESLESVQNALNKTVPNDSDETDYDKCLTAMKTFHADNKDLFMAMMK